MKLIGDWGDRLSGSEHDALIRAAVKSTGARCCCCGFETVATASNPSAGFAVCVVRRGLPIESANLITLCAFCYPLNSVTNLISKGHFVELPWYTQSQFTNLQRTLYCVQASRLAMVKKLPIYAASNALLKEFDRTPEGWDRFTFTGSPERIKQAIDNHKGYTEGDEKKSIYIDRLRFMFSPEAFLEDINEWVPIIEAQVLNAYAK